MRSIVVMGLLKKTRLFGYISRKKWSYKIREGGNRRLFLPAKADYHSPGSDLTPYEDFMKKKVLIALGVVILVLIGALVFVSMKASSIVAAYKPEIEKQLSESLGSPVSLGEISVSVFPSVSLSVDNVSVKGAGSAPLSMGALRAHALLMPLLSKRLELTAVEIVKPKITLVKGVDGSMAVEGIAAKPRDGERAPAQKTQPSGESSQSPLSIDIKSIAIQDGEIAIQDRKLGSTISMSAIQLVSSVALEGPRILIPTASLKCKVGAQGTVALSAKEIAFNSSAQTLTLKKLSLDTGGGAIDVAGTLDLGKQSGDLAVTSSGVALDKVALNLQGIAPTLGAFKPSGSLGLDLKIKMAGPANLALGGGVSLKGINATLPGQMEVRELSGGISTTGPTTKLLVSSSDTSLILQGAPLKASYAVEISPAQVVARSFDVRGFSGSMAIPASLGLDGARAFSAIPKVSGLSLEPLLKSFAPAASSLLVGTLATFNGDFKGALLPSPATTIQGPGSLLIKNGALKGVNLPGVVLSKVDSLPFLEGSLRQYVPPQFQKYVTSPDTSIKELQTSFVLNGTTTTLNSLVLSSDIFSLESAGTLSTSGEMSLTATILFTPEFSLAVAARSEKVKRILDPQNRIVIPLAITGRAPAIIVVPNVSKLLEMGAQKAIEKKVGDLLQKKLGGSQKGGFGKGLGGLLGGR